MNGFAVSGGSRSSTAAGARVPAPARAVLLALIGALSIAAFPAPAAAQDTGNLDSLLRALRSVPTGRTVYEQDLDGGQAREDEASRVEARKDKETEPREETISPLEIDFSNRAGQPLLQFGYDLMRRRRGYLRQSTGALQDSYQLGIGDQVLVTLHGREWRNIRIPVDRSGRIILPEFPPIEAVGRTLGELRGIIRAHVKRTMLGTEAHVTIGDVRSVDVTVIGEVAKPGLYHQPGLYSLIDTLIRVGGPNKNGSLRGIRIHRGISVRTVDLYDLFIHGRLRQDLTMREGDLVSVPLIGRTVAVAGHVKRPGVYELPAGQAPLLRDVVRYAGGPVRPRGNRYIRISVAEDGRETVREHRRLASLRASDGDVLIVQPGANVQLGWVTLEGEVRVPGKRSLAAAHTVRGMIGDVRALGRDAYLPFAVVRRLDDATQSPVHLPLNLLDVVAGRGDLALRSFDTVIVFHRADIEFLRSADVQAVLSRTVPPSLALVDGNGQKREKPSSRAEPAKETARQRLEQSERFAEAAALFAPLFPGALPAADQEALAAGSAADDSAAANRRGGPGLVREDDDQTLHRTGYACAGLRALSSLIDAGSSERFANARRILATQSKTRVVNIVRCPDVYDRYPDILAFVLDNVVAVDGEVLAPGIYPVASATPLTTIAKIAGGLTREADLSKVETTRVEVSGARGAADYRRGVHDIGRRAGAAAGSVAAVGPGDSVRFNRVFTQREEGPVLLTGEFRRPGTYRIRRGERLSQVIARAGGLTEQAYPYGAVFLRESARRAQSAAIGRQAERLRAKLAVYAAKAGPGIVAAGNSLIEGLRDAKPIGRVVIEADPTVLEVRPEQDIAVEPGDHLIVPKRPTAVHVSGAVLNPNALRFDTRLGPRDYIDLAGGFDESADEDRTFVILPDGKAQLLQVSYWNHGHVNLPPGSMIVVPRDPSPFELGIFLRETTDIISKTALTAASVLAIID